LVLAILILIYMTDCHLKEIPTICGLCPHGCWIRAYVSKEELVAVTADSDHRYGSLCGRGRLAPHIVYSPDRIKTPLIRSGPKGKISFRKATWDEAIDRIACEFIKIRDRYSASAVASYLGAGTLEDGLSDFFTEILAPFGSPNDMNCGSVCYVSSRILAPVTTIGIPADSINTDFENSEIIILWGANPFKDGLPDKMRQIKKARSQGAKLIVIDPRRHRLTRDADYWIPVIPGTDGALILSIIKTIIDKGWYDRDFVEKWTLGFNELAEYVSNFTSNGASWICGVGTETIEWLAATIARSSRVAIDFYSGLEYAPSGVQNTRALYSLIALTGNLDKEGGLYIHEYPHKQYEEYTFDDGRPPLGSREYPLFYALTGKAHISGLPAAALHNDPYPVRGLLIVGGSPLRSYPDQKTWKQVYEQLDFMAVVDRFMPEEAAWADVVLPATTYYEIDSYQIYRDSIRLRRKLIEPVGEARNDSLILAALAEKLGYGDSFPQNEKEIIKQGLRNKHIFIDHVNENIEVFNQPLPERRIKKYESGHLRQDGKPGFPTPSGKFEFASTLLKRYGYDSLPVYRDPRLTDCNNLRSLMLTTGARSRARFNSQYLDRPELAERNKAVVEMNPLDAEARGIQSGDVVSVQTSGGQLSLMGLVTADICPGVVHIPYGGGGHRQVGLWRDANVNKIIPHDVRDPLSGYPVLKAVMCEVILCDEKQRVRIKRCMETQA
jgi:anaerobic selenocysteine-containing dehydrogenase